MTENNIGKWIWFPDDFETELSSKFMAKRYERDVIIPPFWKESLPYRNVKFIKEADFLQDEVMKIEVEGQFNVELDGKYVYGFDGTLAVKKGKHRIVVSVYNKNGLPALKVDSRTCPSGENWFVTCNDHKLLPAAYNDTLIYGDSTPNNVKLPVLALKPVRVYEKNGKIVYDFGKEIFAYVRFSSLPRTMEKSCIYYGESEDEALDNENCELITKIENVSNGFVTDIAKAFRYLTLDMDSEVVLEALFEYLPTPRKSCFRSSDQLLNKIYETALYTLSLNLREFIIDGIKRDRWIWSGDAYQGYLMNYYSFFDKDVVRRTMTALFGKPPFDQHMNHILDYTFFWILGFCDYYDYTGDEEFLKREFHKAVEVLEYCISRTNANGLSEGKPDDWVFIDWANGLDNTGEVCFEQILYSVCLKKISLLARKAGIDEKAERYEKLFDKVSLAIEKFWDEEKGGYVHSFKNGASDGKILRYANMFAILYDVCGEDRKAIITEKVLKSDEVQALTTPYMKFYELAALMKSGETEYVMSVIDEYWGGMIDEGATSFWETFDKSQKGNEKYAMYGRKYGKSLCHAWGASPLYLIGRYLIGLKPENQGRTFSVCPQTGGLKVYEASIPLCKGFLTLTVTEDYVELYSDTLSGTLTWKGKAYYVKGGEKIKAGG